MTLNGYDCVLCLKFIPYLLKKEVPNSKEKGNSNQQLEKFNHELYRQSNYGVKRVMENNRLAYCNV